MTHRFVAIPETSALITNIIMKLIFWDLYEDSYFFHISLNIGRSDMKQKAKNSVRSMLSCPFIYVLFWRFLHIFCVTIFFGFSHQPYLRTVGYSSWIFHGLWDTLSNTHRPLLSLDVFEGSNVHRPAYFYIEKKLKMSILLVTYIRKNPFELSKAHTHPYTRTPLSARGVRYFWGFKCP